MTIYVLGLGVVATGAKYVYGMGKFTLTHLKNPAKIGSRIKEKDIRKDTETSIIFVSIKDVDRLIKKLEKIKKGMIKTKINVRIVRRKK